MTPRPWHHTSRGFRNPPGSPSEAHPPSVTWKFIWWMLRQAGQKPVVPDGHILTPAEIRAGLDAMPDDSLTWLGHAAFLLRTNGRTILFDPFLGDWASPLPGLGPRRFMPPAVPPEALPPIDLLLISHNHYDHLCLDTLRRLPGRERTSVVVPLGLAPMLKARGFTDVREADWGHRVDVGGIGVTALPAIHWSKRGLFDRNRTLWCSFAVDVPKRKLWFSGDTAYGPVFRDIGRDHGPFDLAMIPIGAYQPREMMGAHHADPEEAVQIGRDIGAARLVAMHWGTIRLTTEDPFEPPQRYRAAAERAGYAEEDAWLMKIGETRALDPWPRN